MEDETEQSPCWIERELGRGSYGNVYLLTCSQSAKTTDHIKFALKVIEEHGMRAQDQEAAHKELRIMRGLYHPNIVTLIDSFQVHHRLLLALELCEGGDLRNFLDSLKERGQSVGVEESLVVQWTLQLTAGLQYLHHKKILHRDLKPQNIFLKDKFHIKIGDLGIARQLVFTKEMAATHIGTPLYISPEIYQGNSYSYKADMWSLGCCVYEMMTLQYAFHAPSRYELVGKVVNKQVLPLPKSYSQSLRNLVLHMLCKDPEDRPHTTQLMASLQELNTEQPQPQWQRSKGGESELDRSERPKDAKSLQIWRLRMANALTQFLGKKQAVQSAQLRAALAEQLSSGSIRGFDTSSGKQSSQSGVSSAKPRRRVASNFATSESRHEDEKETIRSSTLSHSTDMSQCSENTENDRSRLSASDATLCTSQSQTESRGSRAVNGSRIQSGYSSPGQHRQRSKDKLCDNKDGGRFASDSYSDSDDSSSQTLLPGGKSEFSCLKIGKSSMVVRARPLPQPRLYEVHADDVENSLDHQNKSDTSASTNASTSTLAQNSVTELEASGSSALELAVNTSVDQESQPSSHQNNNAKDVDMAYANEVLNWARAKLLPSSPHNFLANGGHDNNNPVASAEVEGIRRVTSSGKRDMENGVGVRNVLMKEEACVRDMVAEKKTGATPDAERQACVSQEKGKKKKRNFLRERKVKQVESRATEDVKKTDDLASKDLQFVKDTDKHTMDTGKEQGVTLYTRAQYVKFSNLNDDDMDLSISNESYS